MVLQIRINYHEILSFGHLVMGQFVDFKAV